MSEVFNLALESSSAIMKNKIFRSLIFLLGLVLGLASTGLALSGQPSGKPENSPVLAAVTAADDRRVAAFKNPTKEALSAIFSDNLHYAHSNGVVDTKATFLDILTSGKTKYLAMDYEKRDFSFPAPGMALMTGRVRIRAATADSTLDNVLSFLAVWKLENGQWRFLAWQSCRLPATDGKK